MARSPWRVREVDAVDDGEWEDLLAEDPRSLIFQHPNWLRRYIRFHPRKAARWLEVRDREGRLHAGLAFSLSRRAGMRAIASGVAGAYGGPVSRAGSEEAEAELMRRYLRVGGWRTILREMLWAHAEPPAGDRDELLPVDAAAIDLSEGFEAVWSQAFSNNRRNECNRSQKRGLHTEAGRDARWLEEFFPLYRERCVEWKTRPLPDAYLRAVLEEEPDAVLSTAHYEGRVVGLHLCLDLPQQLFAWVGGSEHLRDVFPSTMLVRQDALLGLERGRPILNLGSSLGLGGVARFKELMGAGRQRAWLLRRESGWLRRLRRA